MAPLRSIAKVLSLQLKEHPDLWPLAAALVAVGVGSIATAWHASKKNDVMLNRWTTKPTFEKIPWDSPKEKLYNAGHSREMYKDDPELKCLLREIYKEGDYK